MITDIKENNVKQYVKSFTNNPERFAIKLWNNELKEYGVRNSDFWKKFIINLNNIQNDEFLEDKGLYKHLARMYFVGEDDKKQYLIEKLHSNSKKINKEKVEEIATQLKEKGVIVNIGSAVLIDEEKQQYKFLKYTIKE